MDDLAGLDWTAPNKTTHSPNPPTSFPLRQTPTPQQLSGRSTPLSGQQSGAGAARALKPPSKPPTPAEDSFAGLLSRNSAKSLSNQLSLQERQRRLQEEKRKQELERQKQYGGNFGQADAQFWDTLGSGKSTPQSGLQSGSGPFKAPVSRSPAPAQRQEEDDLLAAFNSSAPVDSSSHFPPPASRTPEPSRLATPASQPSNTALDDDDDIFGLKSLGQNTKSTAQAPIAPTDDDDILGLLGKPVTQFQKPREPEPSPAPPAMEESADMENPQAKAVAELVGIGFPAEKAAAALARTESGLDVQAAVGYILNQAHAEAKQKSRAPVDEWAQQDREDGQRRRADRRPDGDSKRANSNPWGRREDERSRSGQRRDNGQPGGQDKDVAQVASEIGSSLFKSANSLWKTGRKQVQKAVADFQQDGDPNVPKWMRAAQDDARSARAGKQPVKAEDASVTDEAMLLELGRRPEPSRPKEQRSTSDRTAPRPKWEQNARDDVPRRDSSRSPFQHPPAPIHDRRPAAKLTRQDVEEQSTQAYISPARRKKATPSPQPSVQESAPPAKPPRPQAPSQSNNPFLQPTSRPTTRSPAPAVKPRPKAPPRQVPPVSPSALNSSAAHRQKGTEAFKRGDYSAAHAAYSSALGPLPSTHPVTIVVLCNRAVTNIKVGDPKAAISDADAALGIIGASRGEGERIDLGGAEGSKDMKEFYGKALMRKAEALENMEKWADAGKVWRTAVEAGVGGAVSIQGRNRCDKAAGGGDKAAALAPARRPPVQKPPPRASALADLGGQSGADSAAVKRLKEANAAAEKADDEKFALTDQVDAKLAAWKGTKADNLRALLGSLDKVLWPEAGWNKVNMSDLVLPNKVKIVYMKAIAKVHPDKISQSATTEQRMVSAAVFATLNEAWDKFKTENGM
ncbi:hypothetical protein M011DRAFT_431652 [Sporormia fimetaria CBS 119925]|uniref:UBA domain-containing protein n=1 Tax=Sporormia fimetaria CBS 119925 TaxID=1340428 RepID=A0A6A6UZS8_9PLEO|nr:hypothetical protein M011DRAFT_431652 [Sporormia fimetaria CBS 119925]